MKTQNKKDRRHETDRRIHKKTDRHRTRQIKGHTEGQTQDCEGAPHSQLQLSSLPLGNYTKDTKRYK